MKVKELISKLKPFEDLEVAVSSDEEWNTIFKGVEFQIWKEENVVVLFGLSTTRYEEN